MVLRMPGHFGELFTLIDHEFHGDISTTSSGKGKKSMCLRPMLEIVYDIHTRDYLLSIWWSRRRLLDFKWLPWPRDAKMTDINLSVLDNDPPIRQCYPPFRSNGFGLGSPNSSRTKATGIDTHCAEHNRTKQKEIHSVLSAQLACNIFEPEQFIALLFERYSYVKNVH